MLTSTLNRLFVVVLALGICAGFGVAREIAPPDADEAALKQAKLGTSDDDLLAFLKGRSAADDDLAQTEMLVKKLGSTVFAEREDATKRLVALGRAALPALHRGARDKDPEVVKRVEQCIRDIENASRVELNVIRLLGRRAPAGAAAALLRFVPYTVEEHVEEAAWFTLDALARKDGQIDGTFEAALKDRLAARRAAAGYILARYGKEQQRTEAIKLLDDVNTGVQLRTAQGLLGAKDKQGLPTLIRLLGEEDLAVAWQAEELLRWAAGPAAPKETVGSGSAESRKKCGDAWQAWWQKHGDGLDMVKRPEDWQRPGLVLLCDPGQGWEQGHVWLVGCDGVTRCLWEGLRTPVEARLIAGPRILVAENPALFKHTPPNKDNLAGGRVTERDVAGKVHWEYDKFPVPVECRRLLNGNTLIVTKEQDGGEFSPEGLQVDPKGRKIFTPRTTSSPPPHYCRLTSEGRLLVAEDEERWRINRLIEIDPVLGEVADAWCNGVVPLLSFSLEEAGAGKYLVSGTSKGEVFEVESGWYIDGNPNAFAKKTFEQTLPGSTHAVKLPDGQVLVAAGGRVATLNCDGNTVVELMCDRSPFRVRPCFYLIRLGFETPAPLDESFDVLIAHRLRGLKSDDSLVRCRSAELLGDLGPRAAETITALEVCLRDPDDTVRTSAKKALPKVGVEELAKLLKDLKDRDAEVREKAAHGLRLYPRIPMVVIPALAEALKDPDWRVRDRAAGVMGGIELEADQAASQLIVSICDVHPHVRIQTVHSLGRLGPSAKVAVPALLRALKGDDQELRSWAALSLGKIGPCDKGVVIALIESLNDDHAAHNAALALRLIGPEAKKAIPVFVKLLERLSVKFPLNEEDSNRLGCFSFALGGFGAEASEAVPALVRIVKAERVSMSVKQEAVVALGRIGKAAFDAIPALEMLLDQDERVGKLAIEALNRIRSKH